MFLRTPVPDLSLLLRHLRVGRWGIVHRRVFRRLWRGVVGIGAALGVSAWSPTPRISPTPIIRNARILHPVFRERLLRVLWRMQYTYGYHVSILETVRSQVRQDSLYRQGRVVRGPVVTWTRASLHADGLAADVQIEGATNRPAAFDRLWRVAHEEGLRTLGTIDPGHLELPVTAGDIVAIRAVAWRHVPEISPVRGGQVTRRYGERQGGNTDGAAWHAGVDVSAPEGALMVATADGVVSATTDTPHDGWAVDVDHGNGLITRYADARRLVVRPGDPVVRGQPLGEVGRTNHATGPHCHYEVYWNGRTVDPLHLVWNGH